MESVNGGKDMNYISAVYGIVILIVTLDWFIRGRREYRGASTRREEMEYKHGMGMGMGGEEIIKY
jgi:hypothetical protein